MNHFSVYFKTHLVQHDIHTVSSSRYDLTEVKKNGWRKDGQCHIFYSLYFIFYSLHFFKDIFYSLKH